MKVLELRNIGYKYDKAKTPVFEGINYSFDTGKVYAIVGKSGAGKTTLLSLLSGLAVPTSGQILYKDNDIAETDKYAYRSKYVGVVFQSFNLLPHMTAAENVILSMDVSGMKCPDKKRAALELLEKVEIDDDKANRRILKLSGGEQQRVAIARAISYDPDIILADEPTGNLDGETRDEIMDIFRELADEGKCVIIVTHSQSVAKQADEVFSLQQKATVDAKRMSRDKRR